MNTKTGSWGQFSCGLLTLVGIVSLVGGAHGETRNVYVNANKYGVSNLFLYDTTHWTETKGSKTAVSVRPTQADDVVWFEDDVTGPKGFNFYVCNANEPVDNLGLRSFSLSALKSTTFRPFVLPGWTAAYYQTTRRDVTISIANPDGFVGRWLSGLPAGTSTCFAPDSGYPYTLNLTGATTVHTSKLSHVWATSRAAVNVPDAGTRATVEAVAGGGLFEKQGAGDLTISRTDGARSQILVSGGTVTLEGDVAGATVEELLSQAHVHLDASEEGCFKTFEGADGRTYVTNWSPVAGTAVSASRVTKTIPTGSTYIDAANPPFVSPVTSPSGKRLLDFGSMFRAGSASYPPHPELGPSNCVLRLSEDVKDIREVFYVAQYTYPVGSTYNPVLGSDNGTTPFLTYVPYLLPSASSGTLVFGDNRFNDVTFGHSDVPWTPHSPNGMRDLFVFSCAPTSSVKTVNLIASDNYISSRTGGMRVGEVLVFKKSLTSVERSRINAWLKEKWLGERAYDAGPIHLKDGAAIEVPAGRIVRVPSVSTEGSSIVKKGAGTLVCDSVYPASATFDVRGGSVQMASRTFATTAPAANPLVWLDASADGTVTTNATGQVTNWADCRAGAALSAVVPTELASWQAKSEYPTLALAVSGSRPAVDFGTFAWMRLSEYDAENGRTGFIVMRYKPGIATSDNDHKNQPIFGSTGYDGVRNTLSSELLYDVHGSARASAAVWTRDGHALNPWLKGSGSPDTERFHVYSVSANGKLRLDLLCKDRPDGVRGSGFEQIAEFIVYDRLLTTDERRQTEAYLMAKWNGEAHPATGDRNVATLSFASDVPAVFDTEGTENVKTLAGGNGTVVKRGTGSVTASLEGLDDLRSISVASGRLAYEALWLKDAVYHLDASDADSMETYSSGGKTFVRSWSDVQGNGVVAALATNNIKTAVDGGLVLTNPTL